jgi:hypothetical protein
MEESEGPDGYFSLRDRPLHTPGSIHSTDSMSMNLPCSTLASLTALQYLPIPILVLSSCKTVDLANEAMGRLLGIDFENTVGEGDSITDCLRGKRVADLGIDILQNGSPILVSWEVRLYYRLNFHIHSS